MQIDSNLPAKQKTKKRSFFDETQEEIPPEGSAVEAVEEETFKSDVFYVIVDAVVAGLSTRYDAAYKIDDMFGFLWRYLALTEQQILAACVSLAKKYKDDISQDELREDMLHLKTIHAANFGDESLSQFSLLNKISKFKLGEIFPNVCIALRIFCTLPVTVASAERSFSKLCRQRPFEDKTKIVRNVENAPSLKKSGAPMNSSFLIIQCTVKYPIELLSKPTIALHLSRKNDIFGTPYVLKHQDAMKGSTTFSLKAWGGERAKTAQK